MSLNAAATEAGIPPDEAEAWAAQREKEPDRLDETLRAVALAGIRTSMKALTDIVEAPEPAPIQGEPVPIKILESRTQTRVEAATELARLAVALVRMVARPKARPLAGKEKGQPDLFDAADPWQG